MEESKKFGDFDLSRTLSHFEIEHFDEFMKPENNEIHASEISLKDAVDHALVRFQKYAKEKRSAC